MHSSPDWNLATIIRVFITVIRIKNPNATSGPRAPRAAVQFVGNKPMFFTSRPDCVAGNRNTASDFCPDSFNSVGLANRPIIFDRCHIETTGTGPVVGGDGGVVLPVLCIICTESEIRNGISGVVKLRSNINPTTKGTPGCLNERGVADIFLVDINRHRNFMHSASTAARLFDQFPLLERAYRSKRSRSPDRRWPLY